MAIFLAVIQIAGLTILSPGEEQGDPPARARPDIRGASQAQISVLGHSAVETARSIAAEVQTERLDVFDRPDDSGFVTGRVHRGDRLHIRADRSAGTGWLAIEPLPTAIFWIEQSSLEIDEEEVTDAVEHDRRSLAWVNRSQALIRSGHPQARLPGPPRGILPRGTMVQLVDRPPLSLGQGPEKSRWLAIVPPADQVSYVRVEGVRWLTPTPPVPPVAEFRASYEEPIPPSQAAKQRSSAKSVLILAPGGLR